VKKLLIIVIFGGKYALSLLSYPSVEAMLALRAIAASLPKIAILLGAGHELEHGNLAWNQELDRDLNDMIRVKTSLAGGNDIQSAPVPVLGT
jgi:hypothetical protein